MKKFWRTVLSVMLVLVMAAGLFACQPNDETGGGDDLSEIAGDYGIWVADMGFSVYFRVTADGKFQFSSAEGFSDDKASGTVGKLTSNYLMMYTSVDGEPVTTGTVANTHFVAESDGRLRFTDRISYGSAGISSDETNSVYAVPLDEYEEPVTVEVTPDTYFAAATFVNGEENVSATLYLTLEEGTFRLFAVNAAENFLYSQSGTYRTMNGTILLEVNGESFGNVIGIDQTHVQLATEEENLVEESLQMAKSEEEEVLYRFEGTSPTGRPGYDYTLSLDLYANGRYEYKSSFEMNMGGTVVDMGTSESGNYAIDFTATENNITLTPAGGESVSATWNFETGVFTGKMYTSEPDETTDPADITMTLVEVVYTFTGSAEAGEVMGNTYYYDLTLELLNNNRYNFVSSFEMNMGGTMMNMGSSESGTYVLDSESTENNLTLTPDGGEAVTATFNMTTGQFSGAFILGRGETERQNVAMELSAEQFIGEYVIAVVMSETMSMTYELTIQEGENGIVFDICREGETTPTCTGTVLATVSGGTLVYTVPADANAPFEVQADGSLEFTGTLAVTESMSIPAGTLGIIAEKQ